MLTWALDPFGQILRVRIYKGLSGVADRSCKLQFDHPNQKVGKEPLRVPEFTRGRKQTHEHGLHRLPTNPKSAYQQMLKKGDR